MGKQKKQQAETNEEGRGGKLFIFYLIFLALLIIPSISIIYDAELILYQS